MNNKSKIYHILSAMFLVLFIIPQIANASSSSNFKITINPQNNNNNNSGGGGGGGGGGGSGIINYIPPVTSITFSGRAYPLSKISVLKDGQKVISTIAGPDANFTVSLTGLSTGNYMFSIYGEDSNGTRSSLFTFPVFITQGANTTVSGIFIAPTISTDKTEVKRGDNIIVFGQSIPDSQINISVNSNNELFVKAKADKNGVYKYTLATDSLENGNHSVKSKATANDDISSFSNAISFVVGASNVYSEPVEKKIITGDFSGDKKVNLIDFSIAAFWYKKPNPPSKIDLNGDGKVDLVDFSILAYNWTE